MARGRQDDQVEIELLFGDPPERVAGNDVAFGRPGRNRRTNGLIAAGIGAIVLLIAGANLLTNPRRGRAVQSTTTVQQTTTLPTTVPGSDPLAELGGGTPPQSGGFVSEFATPYAATTAESVGPSLPYGSPTGAMLYLPRAVAGGAPGALDVYNVDTGALRTIGFGADIGTYFQAFDGPGGVFVDGVDIFRVGTTYNSRVGNDASYGSGGSPNGRLASGPGGLIWIRDVGAERLVLLDAAGLTDREYSLPRGADLIGSMADGRPVVRGSDQRSYVIEVSGVRSLLSSGLTSFVDHGRFTETSCDDQQHCTTVGHIDGQKRGINLPADTNVVFQPDGDWLALVHSDESLSLLNGLTGEEIKVGIDEHVPYIASGDYGPYGNTAANVRFLPHGIGLAVGTSTNIAFVDLHGAERGTVSLHGGSTEILGVGALLG
jgi:hypothetical protein